jgi:hypothetical protein
MLHARPVRLDGASGMDTPVADDRGVHEPDALDLARVAAERLAEERG